jgi:Zn-dependent peptidase ImmA (M78 family)
MNNYLNTNIIDYIKNEYKIKITYCDEETYGKVEDEAYSTYDEIFLGKYSGVKIEALCFFHELGHIVSNRNKSNKFFFCTLSQESAAWETAIELLIKHKDLFNFEFDLDNYCGEELTFMRKCLKSYFNSEYNELNRN